MSATGRFARYLARDENAKEWFLDAIATGASEADAAKRLGTKYTLEDVRSWLREDPDFAQALRVARRGGFSEPRLFFLDEVETEMRDRGELPGGVEGIPPPGASDSQIAAHGWQPAWHRSWR